ncbi:MAG TPA: flagellar protein FlaG [Patescibacteria group bacterium]|nr:flagellar protein FlaG [Patescibacteria group bacterium]
MITPIQNTTAILQTKPIVQVKTEIGDSEHPSAGGLKADVKDMAAKQEVLPAANRPSGKQGKGATVEFDILAEKIKSFLELDNVHIQFSRDEESSKMVLKLIDTETKEVIRQIPEETVLEIARFISKKLDQGYLTDAKV